MKTNVSSSKIRLPQAVVWKSSPCDDEKENNKAQKEPQSKLPHGSTSIFGTPAMFLLYCLSRKNRILFYYSWSVRPDRSALWIGPLAQGYSRSIPILDARKGAIPRMTMGSGEMAWVK